MPPPPIPAPAAGAGQISAYEEVKPLGKGAFGMVYLVRERATKRKWVMKRVALKGMQPRERQSAFQEARLLQRLRHPHICSYQDSFVNKPTNQLCLVMTFCPGGDMHGFVQDHKKRNKRVAEEQIVQWLLQLTLALEYIHDRHIIHRDLKTQNVFIGRDGSLRLGDFGLAKVLERTDDFATTFTGTPFYLAPQFFFCMSQNHGFQSDLWSLGCILYELCSLEHAFAADSLLSLVYKIVRGNFEPLPAGRYDPRLCALVDALLAREPGARPTARALWRDPWLAAKKADIEEWVEAKQRGRVAPPAPEPGGGAGGGAAAPGGSLGSSGASEGGEAPGPGPRGAAPASLSEQALTPRERMLARKAEAARLRQMELQVAGREQARSRLAPAAGRGAGGAAASGTSCDGIIGTQSDFVRVEQPAAARYPKETAKSDPSPDRSELLRPGGAEPDVPGAGTPGGGGCERPAAARAGQGAGRRRGSCGAPRRRRRRSLVAQAPAARARRGRGRAVRERLRGLRRRGGRRSASLGAGLLAAERVLREGLLARALPAAGRADLQPPRPVRVGPGGALPGRVRLPAGRPAGGRRRGSEGRGGRRHPAGAGAAGRAWGPQGVLPGGPRLPGARGRGRLRLSRGGRGGAEPSPRAARRRIESEIT